MISLVSSKIVVQLLDFIELTTHVDVRRYSCLDVCRLGHKMQIIPKRDWEESKKQ